MKKNSIDRVITSVSEISKPSKPIRPPDSVYLDPVLQLIQGWSEVTKAAEEEMNELGLGLGDWQIDVHSIRSEDAPENPSELPWPDYYDEELRMDFSVRPEPVLRKKDIENWALSTVDFLYQYVY